MVSQSVAVDIDHHRDSHVRETLLYLEFSGVSCSRRYAKATGVKLSDGQDSDDIIYESIDLHFLASFWTCFISDWF